MYWGMHFFFQAEDGIRDSVASRGLGYVYMRQGVLTTLRGTQDTDSAFGFLNGAMRQRIKAMPADKEKRLEEAVEGGMKNATTTKHELEYSDLCMD